MSDYNSSLPVRTENNGDVVSRISDGTITSQLLTVNADGSVNITDNGGSLTVDATNLDIRDLAFATDKVDVTGSDVTATVTATDLDIRDLTHVSDSVKVGDGTDFLAVNADGSVNITDNGGSLTVDATDLDIRNLVFATDKVDVTGSDVTATVTATDLDIRDLTHVSDSVKIGDGTNFLEVNNDGSINVVPQDEPGTETVNYDTSATVAGGASDNHDFVVTNGGKLYQVIASGSGKMKIEVQIETGSATGVFNTVGVLFNSTANPNMDLDLRKYALIPVGARVRVIRTNRENQAQDVYSTIVLLED